MSIERIPIRKLRRGGQHRNPVPGMPEVWDVWGGRKGVQGLLPVLMGEDPGPALEAVHEYAPEIAGMANRIHKDGFRSVIDVLKTGDTYSVIEGERRVLALAVLLATLGEEGEEAWSVPAYVDKSKKTRERVRLGVSHNATRLGLNPMEEALAFRDMKKDGMSMADIGAAVDVHESTVSRRLKLLKLGKKDQERVLAGKLTAEAACRLVDGGGEQKAPKAVSGDGVRTRLTRTITMLDALVSDLKDAGVGAAEFKKAGKRIKTFKSQVNNTMYQVGVIEKVQP
jgi:ParB-like chromosome segregation protein Spo0J